MLKIMKAGHNSDNFYHTDVDNKVLIEIGKLQ